MNVEALLATGNVDFNGWSTNYSATIPSGASSEYQHTTAATTWTSNGWTNGGTYTITNCGMKGFLYCGGDLTTGGGGSNMYGSIYIVSSVTINTFTLYYDQTSAQNVVLSGATMSRVSWDEISSTW